MPAVLRLSLRALLALALIHVARGVQTPAFSIRGGTVWVSGQQNELTFQPGGASPQIVWKNENPLERGVQVGSRLVLNNWDTLYVFPADSWTPRATTLPSAVTALAASTDTALAFTSEQVWRLKPDGTWSQHPTGIKDHIIDLAHHRGTWVAVGSTIGESVSPDDTGPDRQNWPHWELSELQRRIYWSADGLTWKPAQLPPLAEGDPYGQIVAVAGHGDSWLALGAEGDTYTSKDGRTWQSAESLSGITPHTRLHLHALGARFWAQVTNEEYSHDWLSTTDGKTWSPVPLAPGASIVALFTKSGEVHALGTRQSGRGYETAPVGAFGAAPQSDAGSEPRRVATIPAEPVGAREGALERLHLKNVSQTLTDVAYVAGFYVATGDKGTLFFSADARQWEPVKVSDGAGLGRVLHDGREWFVPSRQNEWGVFRSSDRRTWTLGKRWTLERRSVVVRDGAFWEANFGLGIASYGRGRLDAAPGEGDIKNWDGQISSFTNSPFAVFAAGDRFGLVTDQGDIFTSDNGDYWERVGRHNFTKPDVVTYAAGNGVELLGAWNFNPRGSAELLAHNGVAGWRPVAPPFRNLAGLAYGLGRFVALGTTNVEGQWGLYESPDGTNWKLVGSVGATAGDLVFGPAGFLATGADGSLALYNPAPLPANPMPPRAPTPIPPVSFPAFTTGDTRASTGKGRGPRPLSAEERSIEELRSMVGNAESGDIVAKRTLAFAMSPGGRAHSNPWRAELWFKDALAAGDPQAGRGYAQLLRQWKPDTPFSRLEELHRQSADRGDQAAKTWLEQRNTYVTHLEKAEAGDPAAIMAVAPLLIAGDVVDADRSKALNWVYGAAEKNHAPALRFLLQNHSQELAAKVQAPRRTLSDATYLKFLGQLAETGDVPALRELANGHANGANGIPKDDALAYATALKLARLGDAEAMAFVGGALLDGRGVAKDEAAGRTWITQAADKGNAAAKQWLAQQTAVAERAKTRPPLDAHVASLTPEVFAALELLQATAGADLADADSWALAKAVWADAEYSIIEEDLAQELAAAARPLKLAADDGRTLSFTKKIPATSAAGFAQVFPVAYQPGNTQYHIALWQRTSSAGVLVALARQSPQMKTMVQQGVAQELWGMLNQPAPKDKQAILAYTKQLMESDAAASPAVQKEFRALLRSAYEQARLAAGQTGKSGFIGMGKLPWD